MIQAGKGGFVRAILCSALFGLCAAHAQVVATYEFEDGTAQGWTSFNGASTPLNSTDAAHAGTHSLLTTTGGTGQGGPSISMSSILLPGATYTITVSKTGHTTQSKTTTVNTGATTTVNFTM